MMFFSTFVFAYGKNSDLSPSLRTDGDNSPIVGRNEGYIKIEYNKPDSRERIGKKIGIRKLYLIPAHTAINKSCNPSNPENQCRNGLYETAFIYLEVQSIWPVPVLLTAAKISVHPLSKAIHLRTGMIGELSPKITATSQPQRFLLQPGEIKLITLSQGITLDGVLDFFNEEVASDDTFDNDAPVINANSRRVVLFNDFLRKHYGKKTAIRIELFEKDYQSLLSSDVLLGDGSDLFANGDIATNTYQFEYDAFMGEILYQLKGGKEWFEQRVERNRKASD